jgi:hypothetical protein
MQISRRTAHPSAVLVPALVAVLLAACSVRIPPSSPPPPAETGSPPAPASAPAVTEAPEPGLPTDFSAEGDGVVLTVELDRAEVAPGEVVRVHATFQNRRAEAVDYFVNCGTAPRMQVSVDPPFDDPGRDWPGVAGMFKEYAMTQGLGPGGVPAAEGGTTDVPAMPCRQDEDFERLLPPGASLSADFVWTADIIEGVPAPPGGVEFQVTVGYDRQNEPPEQPGIGLPAPGAQIDPAAWVVAYEELAVTGTIWVGGGGREVISGGEAVDAALADARFANWLATAPRGTWSNANLFLEAGFDSTLGFEVGPHWSVELFLEPRRFGILYVDPWTGEVLEENYCPAPCDR